MEIATMGDCNYGITGWEERIYKTIDLIRKIPKPRMITITRSQGEIPYVPKHIVDIVQQKTLDELRNLY